MELIFEGHPFRWNFLTCSNGSRRDFSLTLSDDTSVSNVFDTTHFTSESTSMKAMVMSFGLGC